MASRVVRRHVRADRHRTTPAAGAPASIRSRARPRPSASRWTRRRSQPRRSSCATRRTRSSPRPSRTTPAPRAATLDADGRARLRRRPTRPGQGRRLRASRTSPATRSPPTTRGRSRPSPPPPPIARARLDGEQVHARIAAEILRAEGLNAFDALDISLALAVRSSATTTSSCSGDIAADAGAGHDADELGHRRRQPDRAAARTSSSPACSGSPTPARRSRTPTSPSTRPHGRARDRRRRRCSSTAPPTATRLSGATAVATLYSNATTATTNPAVTLRSRRHERRPGGGVHVRPRPLDRATRARGTRPGSGRTATASRPIAAERPLLRRRRRRPRSPTGSTRNKIGDPAGGRAAAPAGEPDRGR